MDQAKTFSIGKLARRFAVSTESIRNWEAMLPPLPRTPGGHRRYAMEHVEALASLLRVPVPIMKVEESGGVGGGGEAGNDHAD